VTACAEGASGSPEQQVNAGAVIYVVMLGPSDTHRGVAMKAAVSFGGAVDAAETLARAFTMGDDVFERQKSVDQWCDAEVLWLSKSHAVWIDRLLVLP
jgi:hypothetical protein